MAISEATYLKMMWEQDLCAYCHSPILEGQRVGSGRRSDGGFCRLDCFAKYHALEFVEKASLLERSMPPPNER